MRTDGPRADLGSSPPDLASRLESYCRGEHGFDPQCRVRGLRPLTGGWECEVHAFDLDGVPGSAPPLPPLVLRLYDGDGAAEKADREFGCLTRLYDLDYPVPLVFRRERTGGVLGRPFLIMERIAGDVLGALFPRMGPEEREALLDRLCTLFARLHALPPDDFAPIVPLLDPADPLAAWERIRRSLAATLAEHDLPGFRPVLEWLDRRDDVLACRRLSPAHLDFHPYNVLRTPGDRLVVLDWTAFAVTDFRVDLAWTLVLAHSFEGEILRARLLRGYEEARGGKVAGIETFEVIACLRRLTDLVVSLAKGARARGMRPEAVAAMRRMRGAHRRVHELLTDRTGLGVPEVERLLADLGAHPPG